MMLGHLDIQIIGNPAHTIDPSHHAFGSGFVREAVDLAEQGDDAFTHIDGDPRFIQAGLELQRRQHITMKGCIGLGTHDWPPAGWRKRVSRHLW